MTSMDSRFVAVVSAVIVVGVAGCSAPPSGLGESTAEVTIDGRDTGGPHTVRCTQTGWSWLIETPGDAESGFSATISTGDTVTPDSVTFNDFGGFSGTFWDAKPAKAEANVSDGTFVVSGTAQGAFTDKPLDEVDVPFKVEADC